MNTVVQLPRSMQYYSWYTKTHFALAVISTVTRRHTILTQAPIYETHVRIVSLTVGGSRSFSGEISCIPGRYIHTLITKLLHNIRTN